MKVFRKIMILFIIMICVNKLVYSRVSFPFFDFRTNELCIPTPIDVLEVTVDSIIGEFDKKIKADSMYFYSNRFNSEEDHILCYLQYTSDIWIDGWADGRLFYTRPRERLEKISDYNNLRDWYLANKDSIDWYFYAEGAMDDFGYHLKRDSTGVYVERDSTILPPSVSKTNK